MLALLVSHRAKLWASTITHPCVCGRLGRCIVQRLCATAIVHPCTTRKLRVLAPAAPKIIPRLLSGVLFLVPMAGVEPARYCYQRILSFTIYSETESIWRALSEPVTHEKRPKIKGFWQLDVEKPCATKVFRNSSF